MKTSYWMGPISTPAPIASGLVRLFDTLLDWIERSRQRRALGQLDERLLADMGLDPATARTEADKPFWRN